MSAALSAYRTRAFFLPQWNRGVSSVHVQLARPEVEAPARVVRGWELSLPGTALPTPVPLLLQVRVAALAAVAVCATLVSGLRHADAGRQQPPQRAQNGGRLFLAALTPSAHQFYSVTGTTMAVSVGTYVATSSAYGTGVSPAAGIMAAPAPFHTNVGLGGINAPRLGMHTNSPMTAHTNTSVPLPF